MSATSRMSDRWPPERVRTLISERATALGTLSAATVDAVVAAGRVVFLPAGTEIAARQCPRKEAMLILEGTLRTYSISPEGREYRISVQEPGDIHGLLSCLDEGESPHDAAADTDMCVLGIRKPDLRSLMTRHSDFQEAVLQVVCARLRQSFTMLDNFAIGSPRLRLANRLVELAAVYGRETAAGMVIDLPLTQDSLGAMIGLSRQRTNLHLKAFEREGLIATEAGRLVILELEMLSSQE